VMRFRVTETLRPDPAAGHAPSRDRTAGRA
jgi:hypothetical protein